MAVVDRFDEPVTDSGKPVADRFDIPPVDFSKLGEFDAKNASEGQKWRLALGYLTTGDTKARADIIRKVLPGAVIQADPTTGRDVVTYKGETGFIDKPGVTIGGVLDTLAQGFKYLPAGKLASLGGNMASRAAIAGAGAAATSVAEDVAAIPQGSQQGVSPEKAVVTGVASTIAQPVAETVIAPALSWLGRKGADVWRALRGAQGAVQPDGTLTGLGRKMAADAGLNPDEMTPQLASKLEAAAKAATDAAVPENQAPTATARQALSQRFNTPLTKGEITGDYKQQSLEENLRRMDVTTKAGQIMRDAESQAATALRGNSGESGFGLLRREVAGRTPVTDVADAGQAVIGATKDLAAAEKGAYQSAYKSAREAGAALDSRSYKDFVKGAEAALKDQLDYDASLFPQTAKMLERLRGNATWFQEMGSRAPRKIPLSKLENTRKVINALWKSADETDRMGLNVLRSQFDDMVSGALDSGRVIGSKDAVKAWQDGRALYSRYQQLYAPNPKAGDAEKSAGRIVQNWLKSDNVTGEEVIRGAVNNKALTERILTIHGADSPAHSALKQGALEYVFRPALKGEGISPRLIVTQYERYFRGANREQMAAIFNQRDRAAIAEFVQLAKAKIPEPGVVNFSNTGNVLVKAAQQLLQKLGFLSAATGNVGPAAALGAANVAVRAAKAGQATSAVRGLVPVTRGSPAVVGAVGGVTAENN